MDGKLGKSMENEGKLMSEERMGGAFICLSSCYKCGRQIEIEYYTDHFERKENATFLGRLGTEKYSYCPYCGVKQTGFSPYYPEQKMNLSMEDDPVSIKSDEDDEDDADFWWPEAEGVTLIDEEEEEEPDHSGVDEDEETFVCRSCGEMIRLKRKGFEKIYCYYLSMCKKDS